MAEEIPGSRVNFGDDRKNGTETDDEGKFLDCSVSIAHGQGQTLWFVLCRDDTFFVMTSSNAATFTSGAEVETLVSIDTRESFKARAQTK